MTALLTVACKLRQIKPVYGYDELHHKWRVGHVFKHQNWLLIKSQFIYLYFSTLCDSDVVICFSFFN